MKRLIIISLLFIFNENIISQNLPNTRKVNWQLAGIKNNYTPTLTINFLTHGGNNNGSISNSTLLSNLLQSIDSNGAIIYFPDGEYLFDQPIVLKNNIVLRGQSDVNTILKFNLQSENNLININGTIASNSIDITTNLNKESTLVNVINTSELSVGDYIKILDEDDAKITSTWAKSSTGQIVRIKNINGNNIELDSPLRRNYLLTDLPKLKKINPVNNVQIEKLSILRQDATTSQTSNINIDYASNIKINCIRSINCNFSHIALSNSTNCAVEGSYFQDAFDYGNGGKGYGVTLQFTTGETIIYNNIFNHLRHSILLQAGANGNVTSYNYSINPNWTGVLLPQNSAGDLVLHGNYPYANLFEGNIIQNIVIDDSHGSNGPHNTFLRNRTLLYGLTMNNSPASNSQNFISNEITNTGFLLGNFTISGTDHYQYGNNVRGAINPSGTTNTTTNSLYLNNPLNYYSQNTSLFWPPIGTISNYNIYQNESKLRYDSAELCRCSTNETLDLNSFNDVDSNFIVYPNPFNSVLNLKGNFTNAKIEIYDFSSKLIFEKSIDNDSDLSLETSNLASGIYFLKIKNVTGKTNFKLFKK